MTEFIPLTVVDNFFPYEENYLKDLYTKNKADNPFDETGIIPGNKTDDIKNIKKELYTSTTSRFFSLFYDFPTRKIPLRWNANLFFYTHDTPIQSTWVHNEPNILDFIVFLTPGVKGTFTLYDKKPEVEEQLFDISTKLLKAPKSEYELLKSTYNDCFEPVDTIQCRYNRLIALDSASWRGFSNMTWPGNEPLLAMYCNVTGIDGEVPPLNRINFFS